MSHSSNVSVWKGITYAKREAGEMKLDLFIPDVENPPLIVYIHGGGWISETRENIPDPKRYAADLGCAIASVSYRLSVIPDDIDPEIQSFIDPDNPTPRGAFPDHFVDVKAAIRWLRAHAEEYGYDADQIATWGASAGGHLALLTGTVQDVTDLGSSFPETKLEPVVEPETSGSVQAVLSWYSRTDLARGIDESLDNSPLLIGGTRDELPERFRDASPVTHVSSDTPPILLMHGDKDEVVNIEHSVRFFDALVEAGVNAVFYKIHGLNHVWTEGSMLDAESEPGGISERDAMDRLSGDSTPAQTVYQTTHIPENEAASQPLGLVPTAGPEAIDQFLTNTIK